MIAVVAKGPDDSLTEEAITDQHRGCVLVGGASVTPQALRRAAQAGVVGIVVGGIVDRHLIEYLREVMRDPTFDIGVAITGHEPIAYTIVVTEGFGTIRMASRTFDLLASLEGRQASINGATQIRAGVIRPEVIAPAAAPGAHASEVPSSSTLDLSTPIRIIREPYFGALGKVTSLPSELQQVESETHVRVLSAVLDDGRTVTVPRANVEIIEAR
jgi:hypothetical protein